MYAKEGIKRCSRKKFFVQFKILLIADKDSDGTVCCIVFNVKRWYCEIWSFFKLLFQKVLL